MKWILRWQVLGDGPGVSGGYPFIAFSRLGRIQQGFTAFVIDPGQCGTNQDPGGAGQARAGKAVGLKSTATHSKFHNPFNAHDWGRIP